MNENKILENLNLNNKGTKKVEAFLLVTFSLLLACSIALLVTNYNPFIAQLKINSKTIGKILNKKNEVKIRRFGELAWVTAQGSVYENSTLMTGNNSSATIQIEGQTVTLASNSLIDFKKKNETETLVKVQEGNLEVKGHAQKISYNVNESDIKTTAGNANFSINKSDPQGIRVKSGTLSYNHLGKKIKVDKNSKIKEEARSLLNNKDIKLQAPTANDEIWNEESFVSFKWIGTDKKNVTFQLSRDQGFQKVVHQVNLKSSFYRYKTNTPGTYYWRVFFPEETEANAPREKFILRDIGNVKWKLPSNLSLNQNSISIKNATPGPVYLEVSESSSFEKVLQKTEVKKGVHRVPLYFLGKRFLRVIDQKNRVIKEPSALTIANKTPRILKRHTQEFNDITLSWTDVLKNIPDFFYEVKISNQEFSRSYEAVTSSLQLKLPKDGEYEVFLYAKSKKTKGLLLERKKIKYERVKAPSLKKEVIIR